MTTLDRPGEIPERPMAADRLAQPRPIKFWASLGWLAAATLATVAFVLALVASYTLIFRSPPSEARLAEDMMTCIYVVSVTVLIKAVWRAGWSVRDYFALATPEWPALLLAVAAGVVFLLIDNVVGILDPAPPGASDYLDYTRAVEQGFVPLLWLNSIFIAPAGEEMIFRGFLYRGWSQTPLGPFGAIVLTAALFGLAHLQYDVFGMISIAISGLIMGWLRWRSGSIVPPMVAHAVNNALVAIYIALVA